MGSHSSGAYLGNYAASAAAEAQALPEMPTIDQVLAYSPRFYPTAPKKRSLHLGTGSPNTVSYTNYGVPGGVIEQASAYFIVSSSSFSRGTTELMKLQSYICWAVKGRPVKTISMNLRTPIISAQVHMRGPQPT